jgi:hypothetical protein
MKVAYTIEQHAFLSEDLPRLLLTVKSSFTVIHRIYFSHNSHIEESAVQVYISPSVFTTVKENTKKTSE